MKDVLGDKVEKVVVSHRISESPCVLVTSEHGWTANMERIMKAQALRDTSTMGYMAAKKHLEINPDHPLIRQLEPSHAQLEEWTQVLFDQAALSEGAPLPEPAAYVQRVNQLLTKAALSGL